MESAAFVFEHKENRKEKASSGNKLHHVFLSTYKLIYGRKKKEIDARYFLTVASVRGLEVFPNV